MSNVIQMFEAKESMAPSHKEIMSMDSDPLDWETHTTLMQSAETSPGLNLLKEELNQQQANSLDLTAVKIYICKLESMVLELLRD